MVPFKTLIYEEKTKFIRFGDDRRESRGPIVCIRSQLQCTRRLVSGNCKAFSSEIVATDDLSSVNT